MLHTLHARSVSNVVLIRTIFPAMLGALTKGFRIQTWNPTAAHLRPQPSADLWSECPLP